MTSIPVLDSGKLISDNHEVLCFRLIGKVRQLWTYCNHRRLNYSLHYVFCFNFDAYIKSLGIYFHIMCIFCSARPYINTYKWLCDARLTNCYMLGRPIH